MPHIDLPEGLPGIIGPMAFRPETAKPLNDLAEVLFREAHPDNDLTRGERELIAAYVSKLNDCHFCHNSHATFAALQLDDGWDTVDAVVSGSGRCAGVGQAPGPAAHRRQGPGGRPQRHSRAAWLRPASEGATDVEIHDTVLIAAAFCMYNRYVDGLATWAPPNREDYDESGRMIVDHGYRDSIPVL